MPDRTRGNESTDLRGRTTGSLSRRTPHTAAPGGWSVRAWGPVRLIHRPPLRLFVSHNVFVIITTRSVRTFQPGRSVAFSLWREQGSCT